jgi:hypothetical protein
MRGDFNLPPGCTGKDVDKAAGDEIVECLNCGKQVLAYKLDEQGLCGQCTGNEDWEQE